MTNSENIQHGVRIASMQPEGPAEDFSSGTVSLEPHSEPASDSGGPDAFRQLAPRPLIRVVAFIEAIIETLGRAAAWIGVALIVLVAANVTMRYVFGIGFVGLQELEWHLMSPFVMIGISYALLHNEHVRVDLIHGALPRAVRHFIDLVAALTMIVISIVVAQLSYNYVGQSYHLAEGSPDLGGLPYRWIIKSTIPFGFSLFGLQALAMAIRSWVLMTGDKRHGR